MMEARWKIYMTPGKEAIQSWKWRRPEVSHHAWQSRDWDGEHARHCVRHQASPASSSSSSPSPTSVLCPAWPVSRSVRSWLNMSYDLRHTIIPPFLFVFIHNFLVLKSHFS